MGTGEQRRYAQKRGLRSPRGRNHGPYGSCLSAHDSRDGIRSRQRHSQAIAAAVALCCARAAPPGTVRWASRKQACGPRPRGMGSRLRCPKADPARNRTSPPHSIAGGGQSSLGLILSQNQQAGKQSREQRACHASDNERPRHAPAAFKSGFHMLRKDGVQG